MIGLRIVVSELHQWDDIWNEVFLSQSEVFKNLRIVLAKGHVDMVLGGEFRDGSPKNGHMTGQAEVPTIQISTTIIKAAIPSL